MYCLFQRGKKEEKKAFKLAQLIWKSINLIILLQNQLLFKQKLNIPLSQLKNPNNLSSLVFFRPIT